MSRADFRERKPLHADADGLDHPACAEKRRAVKRQAKYRAITEQLDAPSMAQTRLEIDDEIEGLRSLSRTRGIQWVGRIGYHGDSCSGSFEYDHQIDAINELVRLSQEFGGYEELE